MVKILPETKEHYINLECHNYIFITLALMYYSGMRDSQTWNSHAQTQIKQSWITQMVELATHDPHRISTRLYVQSNIKIANKKQKQLDRTQLLILKYTLPYSRRVLNLKTRTINKHTSNTNISNALMQTPVSTFLLEKPSIT